MPKNIWALDFILDCLSMKEDVIARYTIQRHGEAVKPIHSSTTSIWQVIEEWDGDPSQSAATTADAEAKPATS